MSCRYCSEPAVRTVKNGSGREAKLCATGNGTGCGQQFWEEFHLTCKYCRHPTMRTVKNGPGAGTSICLNAETTGCHEQVWAEFGGHCPACNESIRNIDDRCYRCNPQSRWLMAEDRSHWIKVLMPIVNGHFI